MGQQLEEEEEKEEELLGNGGSYLLSDSRSDLVPTSTIGGGRLVSLSSQSLTRYMDCILSSTDSKEARSVILYTIKKPFEVLIH